MRGMANRPVRRTSLVMVLVALTVAGCASLRTESVGIEMDEGAWSANPEQLTTAARVEFELTNVGSEAHRPLLATVGASPEQVRSHVERLGVANLVAELAGEAGTPGIGAALVHGAAGHFHPADGSPALPGDARLTLDDDGSTARYLHADWVGPGESIGGAVTSGKEPDLGRISLVAVCMVPEHAGRGEYAVFAIAP